MCRYLFSPSSSQSSSPLSAPEAGAEDESLKPIDTASSAENAEKEEAGEQVAETSGSGVAAAPKLTTNHHYHQHQEHPPPAKESPLLSSQLIRLPALPPPKVVVDESGVQKPAAGSAPAKPAPIASLGPKPLRLQSRGPSSTPIEVSEPLLEGSGSGSGSGVAAAPESTTAHHHYQQEDPPPAEESALPSSPTVIRLPALPPPGEEVVHEGVQQPAAAGSAPANPAPIAPLGPKPLRLQSRQPSSIPVAVSEPLPGGPGSGSADGWADDKEGSGLPPHQLRAANGDPLYLLSGEERDWCLDEYNRIRGKEDVAEHVSSRIDERWGKLAALHKQALRVEIAMYVDKENKKKMRGKEDKAKARRK